MHRINKKAFFIGCIVLCFGFCAKGYSGKKATLWLTRESQPDTLGYNFVADLANDIYGWLSSAQVVMWDSPEKKEVLNYANIQGIEKYAQAQFNMLSNVYIYENWSSDKSTFSFSVKGFAFTGPNIRGEEVIYGYVEYDQTLKDLFQKTALHTNADGIADNTLYSSLMNMAFNFKLIYFDNAPVVNLKQSSQIATEALAAYKQRPDKVFLPFAKQVEYGWDSTDTAQARILGAVMRPVYLFLNQNRQEFFNYGGDKYYSFLRDAPVLISGVHVVELWTKDKEGKITAMPQYLIVYAGGIALQPIPIAKLDEWNLKYNGAPLSALLIAKSYPYQLKKINETIIPANAADSYKTALFAGNWYHIAE